MDARLSSGCWFGVCGTCGAHSSRVGGLVASNKYDTPKPDNETIVKMRQ